MRVIRLPRHGASLPVGIGVSCSADRQILAKTLADLEQHEAPIDLAQTLFFSAWAEHQAGQPERAADLVGRALAVAEHVGYDQMLLTEPDRWATNGSRTTAPRLNANGAPGR